MGVIYLLQCGKYNYIGSTINFKQRIKNHKYHLKNKSHTNNILQNVYNKYGLQYIILKKNIPRNILFNIEDIYIGVLCTLAQDRKYGCNIKTSKDYPKGCITLSKMKKNAFYKNKTGYQHNRSIEVHLFNFDGSYFKSFGSANEAAKFLKVTNVAVSNCAQKIKKGKKASCAGYLISFDKKLEITFDVCERAKKQCKKVSMIDPNTMKVVDTFKSIGQACRKYKLNDSNIIKSCKSNLKRKCFRHYWRYEDNI